MAPRLLLVVAVLGVAGCAAANPAARTGSRAAAGGGQVRAAFAARSPAPLSVAYAGPRALRGRVDLTAHVRSGTWVAAVTFVLAGRALGTVTAAPWKLDVDAALLPERRGRLWVTAVNRLGQRAVSAAVRVRVLPGGEYIIHASPFQGLRPALSALAAGSVTVKLAPGHYQLRQVTLGNGARLSGSGAGTILSPPPGVQVGALLSTRASQVRISNLAIDGGGQLEDAVSIGDGSSDVRLQRLEISGVQQDGIAAWGAHRLVSIQDSTLNGGGVATDAGVLDEGSPSSSQTSVVRTSISGFRGYGILFAQRFYGLANAAWRNVALQDRVSDIIDPQRHDGTDAGGIWTGGVQAAVIGNQVADTGTDGIETVGSSTDDTIIANRVWGSPVAIYIEHSTNDSLVARNQLTDVGTGINVEWRHAGGGSDSNTFTHNQIAATQAGVFVDVQEDYNLIAGNAFTSPAGVPIILQGSSYNLVSGNSACRTGSGPFVVQQPARSQTGAIAQSSDNRILNNRRLERCKSA